jgi:arginyl-tRNA synthetase
MQNTGHRIQQLHALLHTIEKDNVQHITTNFDPKLLSHKLELQLAQKIGSFPYIVDQTFKHKQDPVTITQYLVSLYTITRRTLNSHSLRFFSREIDVELKVARLNLLRAARITIANSLWLLGLPPLTYME